MLLILKFENWRNDMENQTEKCNEPEKIAAGTINGKPVYISKTMLASAVTMVAPWIPGVKDFVTGNPEAAFTLAGIVFGILRLVTTKKLDWKVKF